MAPFGTKSVSHPDIHVMPRSVSFSLYTADEVRKLSVVQITTPISFNVLGHPLIGGLYDPRMGPYTERGDVCATCSQAVTLCPGHLGHIELPFPVVNPLFHKTVLQLLRRTCVKCHTLQIPPGVKHLIQVQLKLLDYGLISEAQEAAKFLPSKLDDGEDLGKNDSVAQDLATNENLREYFHSVMRNIDPEKCKNTCPNKNIESLRNEYIRAALSTSVMNSKKKCFTCGTPLRKLLSHQSKIIYTASQTERAKHFSEGGEIEESQKSHTQVFLSPKEAKDTFRKLWENDSVILQEMFSVMKSCKSEHSTDLLFLDVIPVPPPKTRPPNFVNNRIVENPQSVTLRHIIQDCLVLRNIVLATREGATDISEEGKSLLEQCKGESLTEKLQNAWHDLQSDVDHLMDKDMNKTTAESGCCGIKQVIEKKEGLFRMHMMGKRVNYAARSVITPDPNLSIDEIGIPEEFAKKLTYPTPVTPWNVKELQKLIINGPDNHPGAVMVESGNGVLHRLHKDNINQRRSFAKNLLAQSVESERGDYRGTKIVYRHVLNGDILLLNRQPTLHKPSIMAHRARILKGEKTIRLHYANCKAYNADFDGDEMNAHFPQNEVARSEAYSLASVSQQYLVPKDGTPLSGLIQDHIVSSIHLSIRGKFYARTDYQQLVFEAIGHKGGVITLLPPSLLKPQVLWSGKQVISTVMINLVPSGKKPLTLLSKSKIGSKTYQTGPPRPWKAGGTPFTDDKTMSECEVVIRQGELLSGVLDKNHIGATPYGLVHCFYELYGGSVSAQLLSSFSRLFTMFLQREGFTLGVADILVRRGADEGRKQIIAEAENLGDAIAAAAVDLPGDVNKHELTEMLEKAHRSKDPRRRTLIDRKYKTSLDVVTNNINKICLPAGLLYQFPQNHLQLMVQSGAKGSTVNTMQISCLLGQIELEGKRPPLMVSGKSLPSFPPYETSPRAGGFVDGRFMTGIRPQEFFFHCMAGREGLIDTAVKTSRSGYLQRCLVKHLEGLVVNYDLTVRDSDSSVVQFLYGEDGLDVCKSQFLKKEYFSFMADNCESMLNKKVAMQVARMTDIDELERHVQLVGKWKVRRGDESGKERSTPFALFSRKAGRFSNKRDLCDSWYALDAHKKRKYAKKAARCPDPTISIFPPDRHFGAVSEQLEKLKLEYVEDNVDYTLCRNFLVKCGDSQVTCSNFVAMLHLKNAQATCDPGEPVGLLAAQSVGEPSTQMTLNTFHFAGRGEMNVTLGIPRLREILMVASKEPRTPCMDIPFRKDVVRLRSKADALRKKLTRVTLADVLEYVDVKEQIVLRPQRQRLYMLKFQFLPRACYRSVFSITPRDVLRCFEKKFARQALLPAFQRAAKAKSEGAVHAQDKARNSAPAGEDGEAHENDGDASLSEKDALGDEHLSSDEEPEGDEDDATLSKSKHKHQENHEYEEPEEEEREFSRDEDEGFDEMTMSEESHHSDNFTFSDEGFVKTDGDEEYSGSEEIFDQRQRKFSVVALHAFILDYSFDTENEEWCVLTLQVPLNLSKVDMTVLLKTVAEKTVVHEVPLIKRAFVVPHPDTGELMLKTDGINIVEIFKYNELLDLNRFYTNHIHAMCDTYGIEAANRVLVKEIKEVFRVYGITVDPRHLLLIADYMTFDGSYRPCNRLGMENSASPLQQMSFETAVGFLRAATLAGKTDRLDSPSSRLIVGKPCFGGTGSFELVQKLVNSTKC